MNTTDDRLDRMEQKLDALLAAIKSQSGTVRTGTATAGGQEIDADIDGPRGDPEVRFVPKRWTGTDFKGHKFSTCEPEFLDMLAEAYEWFAQRDDESGALDKNGTPKSRWSRLDAARARAWSSRLRGGSASTPPRRGATGHTNGRRTPMAASSRVTEDFARDDNDIPF
jgi:hypothetical protein